MTEPAPAPARVVHLEVPDTDVDAELAGDLLWRCGTSAVEERAEVSRLGGHRGA